MLSLFDNERLRRARSCKTTKKNGILQRLLGPGEEGSQLVDSLIISARLKLDSGANDAFLCPSNHFAVLEAW
jgi:hypothetical protein